MYHNFSVEELRSYCRANIESLEMWARHLIHQKMSEKYGENYVEFQNQDGTFLIKKELRNHVNQMIAKEPQRFKRQVDALFLENIIFFLCNQNWYRDLFKEALDYIYPQGCAEVREFLSRLLPIRNALSHANPISIHQAQQAICYSQDFIEGLKKYYRDKGVEKMWNVPRIIRFSDSLGNSVENPIDILGGTINRVSTALYCGDTYSITVEIDPSFERDSYKIIWLNEMAKIKRFQNSETFSITFGPQDIAETHLIECQIISNKEWHKYTYYDCRVCWHLTVLPPI